MTEKQSDQLWEEFSDVQMEVYWKTIDLKNAKWDSPTLKSELTELVEHGFKLTNELEKIGEFDEDEEDE